MMENIRRGILPVLISLYSYFEITKPNINPNEIGYISQSTSLYGIGITYTRQQPNTHRFFPDSMFQTTQPATEIIKINAPDGKHMIMIYDHDGSRKIGDNSRDYTFDKTILPNETEITTVVTSEYSVVELQPINISDIKKKEDNPETEADIKDSLSKATEAFNQLRRLFADENSSGKGKKNPSSERNNGLETKLVLGK